MKPEIRDQIIQSLLASFAAVGAEDFDEAMQELESSVARLLSGIRSLQTVDQLQHVLDGIETNEEQEKIMLAAFASVPKLTVMFVNLLGEKVKNDFPATEAGRPAIDYFKRVKIVDFICAKMKAGCSLRQAKTRAAMRFGLGASTIQRIWSKRGDNSLPEASAIFEGIQNGTIPFSLTPAKPEKE